MAGAIGETQRRRDRQLRYNEANGITPESVQKQIREIIRGGSEEDAPEPETLSPWERELVLDDVKQELVMLETEMWEASEALDFERAGAIRDRIGELEAKLQGKDVSVPVLPGREGNSKRLKA